MAVDQPHQHDDAEIGVVPGIDQQRLQRRALVALGRRQAGDDRLQHQIDVEAGLGRDRHRLRGVEADHVLDLLLDALGLGGGQVDLVEHRHDLVARVERVIDVGERLRLDPLAGVDDQQRALAGGERPRHLVGEVDVAGRVHQVEDIGLAVFARYSSRTVCALMVMPRSRSMSIEFEHLLDHVALGDRPGLLDEPVGERRLAVVDMGDDREVADVLYSVGGHGARDSRARAGRERDSRGRLLTGRTPPGCASKSPMLGNARLWIARAGALIFETRNQHEFLRLARLPGERRA